MKLRRTMLFVPGNNPSLIRDAAIYNEDAIILDLEDAVSINEKDSARFLVYQALQSLDFRDKEVAVRINDPKTPIGKMDLKAVVKTRKAVIRLPKSECKEDIAECAAIIEEIERENGITVGTTRMMAAIESAIGVLNAKEIAFASPRLLSIALGAEDYCASIKTSRSANGQELLFARCMILKAARAAGIDCIDTVFSDLKNDEGSISEVETIHQLGFDGKSIIHPKQIQMVHAVFTPGEAKVQKAMAVVRAIVDARDKGLGVVSLNGKMIDRPVVLQAERTLMLASAAGLLSREDKEYARLA